MVASYLAPLTAPSADIGAKAAGLAAARAAGARTPDGFAVIARAYDEAVRAAGGPFVAPAYDVLPALERAQAALCAVALPDRLAEELFMAAARLGDRVSVRSSAVAVED